jgi:hypothetical protein
VTARVLARRPTHPVARLGIEAGLCALGFALVTVPVLQFHAEAGVAPGAGLVVLTVAVVAALGGYHVVATRRFRY